MGPFILLVINNLPVPTVLEEKSAVKTCSTEHSRQENRAQPRRAKSMKQSTAGLLGYNQYYERSIARSCLAEHSGLIEKRT